MSSPKPPTRKATEPMPLLSLLCTNTPSPTYVRISRVPLEISPILAHVKDSVGINEIDDKSLAKSSFRYYFSSRSARRESAPAIQAIRDIVLPLTVDNTGPRILIHVFSNGGSCVLYHLYDLYAETATAALRSVVHEDSELAPCLLPPHVTIFDSVPGRWSYSGSTRAVLAALPNGWVRRLAVPLVHLLGLWWVIKYVLLKVPQETYVWGLAHNDPARVHETCRSYVYSEADEFVDYHAVEEHADYAEIDGYVVVRRDKFLNSQHVAHARSDPDRYWSLVRDTWETSQQDSGCR